MATPVHSDVLEARDAPNATNTSTESLQANGNEHLSDKKKAFQGQWHYNGNLVYRRPSQWTADTEKGLRAGEVHEYRNQYGKSIKKKAPGVESYLSTSRSEPRKLIVQASDHGHLESTSDWNRRRITGSVPTALRLSEWSLRPAFAKSRDLKRKVRWIGIPEFLLRTFLIALPLQCYMSFPIFTPPWEEDDAEDTYMDWPGYLWDWPKFAVNELDMSPDSSELKQLKFSARSRLVRPRLLMVQEGDKWVQKNLDNEPLAWRPYVMVSFTSEHFHMHKPTSGPDTSVAPRTELKRIAQTQAKNAGLEAYWLDFECAAQEDGELRTADVNRFCDVVRGASRVVIALPDRHPDTAVVWGKRMWTLPEGLLAPGTRLHVYYQDTDTLTTLSKVEMAAVMWRETNKPRAGEDVQAARLLAEHFSGTLQLSRLQLMSTAIVALWDRKNAKDYYPGELAAVLMGLLHTRIDRVEDNSLFQDIAKLSLLNDGDQLVERMVCLLSSDDTSANDSSADAYNNRDPFRMLSKADQFNTHLWDIHPTCEVVGVGYEDRTVVLNDCRAIPIRWKRFPKMLYKRTLSFKKLLAEYFLRSGAWWFIAGWALAANYTPFFLTDSANKAPLSDGASGPDDISVLGWLGLAVAVCFAMGLLLSFAGPVSLRLLYGGMVVEPALHLIGFEGTMPIHKLEEIIFGNDDGRLSYEASSTPFCKDYRSHTERSGVEPPWVSKPQEHSLPNLRPGYRLFTLVDTGTMSVSIFEARRPPTVALICGREGGMLRSVLCSWDFTKDVLRKETVLRMPTETYHVAKPKGWLKLTLGD